MRGRVQLSSVVAVLVLCVACTPTGPTPATSTRGTFAPTESDPATRTPTPKPTPTPERGGVLRLAMQSDVSAELDPQKEYFRPTWELFRCCLLRTLMSYGSESLGPAGVEPLPDLAASAPTVSEDGMTWTFQLKSGIRYSPPLHTQTVVAADVVRAIERLACARCSTGGYSFYYSAIAGFDEFREGRADTISGLRSPDPLTLQVSVTEPAGHLPHLFAMPATAPIPPLGNERLGIAAGHTADFGRFLVGTGPYMLAGTPSLDPSVRPKDQEPVSGYRSGRSISLIRNPSWDSGTDALRPAYPDRIHIEITTAATTDLASRVDAGDLDLAFYGEPATEQVRRYMQSEELRRHVHTSPLGPVRYVTMNLAAPPFDDVHVRRAVAYALDRRALQRILGGSPFAEITRHFIPDEVTAGLLAGFDPFDTPGDRGSLVSAKDAMRLSRYDADRDGVCDAEACRKVLTIPDAADPAELIVSIYDRLGRIGIDLDVKSIERAGYRFVCNDPRAHVALCTWPAWGWDFPDAVGFGQWVFSGEAIGPDSCCNYSLMGASARRLREWGYRVRSVPSVDSEVSACTALSGMEAARCWADLDRTVTGSIVPLVPLVTIANVDVTSQRVHGYEVNPFTGMAALDRLALRVSR